MFESIKGNENTIMGLPVEKIKEYLEMEKKMILIWFIVCIIFAFVQLILGESGHALEVFAVLTAIALFLINKLKGKIKFTK